jgi:DNA ligase-1
MTLLAEVVDASEAVAATSSRSEKVAIFAELLTRLEPREVPAAVGFLAGEPRQGRVGVGYRTIFSIGDRPAETAALTIDDLDEAISSLEKATGTGSAAVRSDLLVGLFARATVVEVHFLRRLFTGEMRQGAASALVADAVARAAAVPGTLLRRALMLSGDLPSTAALAMARGRRGLAEVGLELFRPVLPMLASTAASMPEAIAAFDDGAFVEWKLDGIRIQVHRAGDEVRIYTRNLNEITAGLPGVVEAIRGLPVREAVFDGEALWMDEAGPAPFQETVARIDSDAPARGTVAFLFDILHLDGVDLLDRPLVERVARLEAVAPELKIPGELTSDAAVGQRVLDEALRAGHEGVVVKEARSSYAAGRRGKSWLKLKPVRTYDLVVLGAEWGHGRRQGWLSNLHLGARETASDGFVMVGKCFKGLTDELLVWQTQALLGLERERRGIAVLVRPELVVEVAIDGVQASTRYPGGLALRFARVKRYRPDKDAGEADTIDALRALRPSR